MRGMKRIATSILFSFLIFVFGFGIYSASAEESPKPLAAGLEKAATMSGLKKDVSVPAAIGQIVKVVLGLLGVLLVLLIIYAGILWMTAKGNSQATDKAKGIIIDAVIGLVVTLLAYQITGFIIDKIVIRGSEAPAPAQNQQ
jgi:hypothetical protein